MVFWTMVYAAEIGLIFNSMCWFRQKGKTYTELTYIYTYSVIFGVYVCTIQ